MKVSKVALAALFALGAVPAFPVLAAQNQQQVQQPPQRQFNLSAVERAAIMPLFQAIEAQNWAVAQAALPAAQAAAQGADARYVVGQARLQIGIQTQNQGMQAEAIDALIASGVPDAQELGPLLTNQAALAISAGNLEKAEAAFNRLVQMSPNDPELLIRLAEIKNDRGNKAEAVPLYQRALQLHEATGQPAPESWYRRALAVAYEARLQQPTLALTQNLVRAHPSQMHWRDALLIFREVARVDGEMKMDLMRLMRAADALNGERDYIELADALNRAGLPGESKAVLEHGISKGMLEANDTNVRELMTLANRRIPEDRGSLPQLRTQAQAAAQGRQARNVADAYFSYGQFAEAAELYRLALQKGSAESDLVNLRLGMSLALGGQLAEAEQAFRAVGGTQQQLAEFWLIWLNHRAG